jgi:hypothetical protein
MADGFKDFNSFQRVLRNRNIDGPIAVVLTEMYVQFLDVTKQMDMCANVIGELVKTVANFAELNEVMNSRVQHLQEQVKGSADGVAVSSEPMTDPEDYH